MKTRVDKRSPNRPSLEPASRSSTLQSKAASGPRQQQQQQHIAQLQQNVPNTNRTGLPDTLKSGIEALSGMDMSSVRVHRNSDKPAALQAHAYAQGSDIHLGPGQEKHLPHEAWHVVQQAQGRVRATVSVDGVGVNNDNSLEREADRLGSMAGRGAASSTSTGPVSLPDLPAEQPRAPPAQRQAIQLESDDEEEEDDADRIAANYLERREREQASKPKPRSRPPGNGKIYDRYKNKHSSHKQQWAADTYAHGMDSSADDYVRAPRGHLDTGRRDRIGGGAEYVAPEQGERTGLTGVPKTVGRKVLGNILSGEPPMRPELGENGKVTWATETHRDGVELPSRPYSGRDAPSNALLKLSYSATEDDRHIPEQAVDRIYRHYESKLSRKKSKKKRGDLDQVDERQVKGEASRLAWKHLGVHGEGGAGLTSMAVPGDHPLSKSEGVFVTMPEHAKHRMTLDGQEKYAGPHGRRPRHPVKDRSDMADFIGTLGPGSYEDVNNQLEARPSTPLSKKEARRRKLAEKKERKQRRK